MSFDEVRAHRPAGVPVIVLALVAGWFGVRRARSTPRVLENVEHDGTCPGRCSRSHVPPRPPDRATASSKACTTAPSSCSPRTARSCSSAGDIDAAFYPRSALKPMQAVAMIRLGLSLPPDLLALAAASHSGEAVHLAGARRILDGCGCTEDDLRNSGRPAPSTRSRPRGWIAAGRPPRRLAQNCSGKHAAMLATAAAARLVPGTTSTPSTRCSAPSPRPSRTSPGSGSRTRPSTAAGPRCSRSRLHGLTRAVGRIAAAARGHRRGPGGRRDAGAPGDGRREPARRHRADAGGARPDRQGRLRGRAGRRPARRDRDRGEDRRRRRTGPVSRSPSPRSRWPVSTPTCWPRSKKPGPPAASTVAGELRDALSTTTDDKERL